VGKSLEVVESVGEFGEDLDLSGDGLKEAGWGESRRRQVGGFLETRVDDAHRPEPDPAAQPLT
jgi:hypothetical protein